ncbi:phospholipase D-like domain-containing protein [Coraliomargarita algicola]|uniref:Phospholipase D-like domain-containing protein n=1 Tax=Coraliomargarita algicola TaxID=3092156 RepID=A0ABZ0RFW7_9BACT|nr:phospholipase D-like domain-containing protein [Coraliomargarita sp. J2-16]WPJ94306.1 phospholipase D-like domain-containing protein [Coraliomargarita sp. J2-16]
MRTIKWILLGALLGVAALPYLLFQQQELPAGTRLSSLDFEYSEARLLVDRTMWDDATGEVVRSHEIFDTILREIELAETFVIADFFLWNPWRGAVESSGELRALAQELAEALIRKRIQSPDIPILVITDPINRIYGDHASDYYARLAGAGIPVVFTDLSQLPDSNRIYAPQAWFWGQYLPAEKIDSDLALIPNPFDQSGEKLTLAQLGRLLYFKANHRKVLVTGRQSTAPRVLVGSFNPADGSANHSNVGALVEGAVAIYAAHSELDIAEWSSSNLQQVAGELSQQIAQAIATIRLRVPAVASLPRAREGAPRVAWRSEGAIQQELREQLNQAVAGTRVDAAVFYFSDRRIVKAFIEAIQRGAEVRLLLDANRDAFGREKNGIPNRAVAAELMALAGVGNVEVRWAATHGEQYHAKVLRVVGERQDVLFLGSANWTRRNLDDLNLEANLLFQDASDLGRDFDAYFEALWANANGYVESLPYEDWAESGWSLRWKTWLYRFQEWSGASTF